MFDKKERNHLHKIYFLFFSFQLFRLAGINSVPNLSSYFQREGPGDKHGTPVSWLVETWCQSIVKTKMSLFLIYLAKLKSKVNTELYILLHHLHEMEPVSRYKTLTFTLTNYCTKRCLWPTPLIKVTGDKGRLYHTFDAGHRGGQRSSLTLVKDGTSLTLVKGGTKVLCQIWLWLGQRYFWLRSKLLLTLTRVKACQRRYQRCCLPLTTVSKIVVHLCFTFMWRESKMRQSQQCLLFSEKSDNVRE